MRFPCKNPMVFSSVVQSDAVARTGFLAYFFFGSTTVLLALSTALSGGLTTGLAVVLLVGFPVGFSVVLTVVLVVA